MNYKISSIIWKFGIISLLTVMSNIQLIAEDESNISGWFRTDTDSHGTQIWFGASHPFGGLEIDSDIYVVGATGEFDIGPLFTLIKKEDSKDSLVVLPMIGLTFDFEAMNIATFVPQFYTFSTIGSIYFESWLMSFLNSPFDGEAGNQFYTRNFLLYALGDVVSIGPQLEVTLNLSGKDGNGNELDSLANCAIGGKVHLKYGKNNTLGLFLGSETKEELREGNDGIVGRLTFVRKW